MRSKKLEKLIKEMTGQSFIVETKKWLWYGFSARVYLTKNYMTIRRDHINFKPVIWHEIGHIKTTKIKMSFFEREYRAEMWALKQSLEKKNIKLFEESLAWVKSWLDVSEPQETPWDKKYARVARKILKDLKPKVLDDAK